MLSLLSSWKIFLLMLTVSMGYLFSWSSTVTSELVWKRWSLRGQCPISVLENQQDKISKWKMKIFPTNSNRFPLWSDICWQWELSRIDSILRADEMLYRLEDAYSGHKLIKLTGWGENQTRMMRRKRISWSISTITERCFNIFFTHTTSSQSIGKGTSVKRDYNQKNFNHILWQQS